MTGDPAARTARWAMALIDGLARAGVARMVVSPGSRSTPLVLAAERHPAVQTFVIIDERAAAYFALGLAKSDGRPAAVICTSGTAAENWRPAVAEADLARVPLVLLSADRPPELVGVGANQTIEQPGMFAGRVRAAHALSPPDEEALPTLAPLAGRLVDRATWPLPGPVHINVPLREPLIAEPSQTMDAPPPNRVPHSHRPLMHPNAATVGALAAFMNGEAGVIVAGPAEPDPAFAEALTALAAATGAPILADPLSQLRRGGHQRAQVFTRYEAFLRDRTLRRHARPRWLLRFGAAPTAKALLSWMDELDDAHQVVVDPAGRPVDPVFRASDIVHADPACLCRALAEALDAPADTTLLEAFRTAEAAAARRAGALAIPEAEVIAALAAALPAGAVLFCGNSMAVREVDAFLDPAAAPLALHANRGVSGIDGTVATIAGLAAGRGPGVATVGLIGDVTLAHDLGALSLMARTDATLVVIDNGGGAIFEYLPQAQLDTELFARHWLTAPGLDITAVAGAMGLRCWQAGPDAELAETIAQAVARPGPDLIRVAIDREESVAAHKRYWAAV